MLQRDVAKMIYLSAPVYSNYETGFRRPSIDTLVRLAEVFDVSLGYLCGIEDERRTFRGELV